MAIEVAIACERLEGKRRCYFFMQDKRGQLSIGFLRLYFPSLYNTTLLLLLSSRSCVECATVTLDSFYKLAP